MQVDYNDEGSVSDTTRREACGACMLERLGKSVKRWPSWSDDTLASSIVVPSDIDHCSKALETLTLQQSSSQNKRCRSSNSILVTDEILQKRRYNSERSMRFFAILLQSDAQARVAAIAEIVACFVSGDELCEEQMLLESFGTICRLAEECPFRDIRAVCQELYLNAARKLRWARPLPVPLPPSPISYFFPSSQLYPFGDKLDELLKQTDQPNSQLLQSIFEDIFLETGEAVCSLLHFLFSR